MNGVKWSTLEPGTAEDVLARLLVRLHSGAQRINGKGGDGGADVIHRADDGLHIYEIKSFADKLNNSRKRQITSSLEAALTNWSELVAWHLVMPIDPTPANDQWFQTLQVGHPAVAMEWIGLAQIEAGLAAHPDIQLAFLPESPWQIAHGLMTTAEQEKAALKGGIPDAFERMGALGNVVSTLDPDYDFRITTGPGEKRIEVLPKDSGSLERSPLNIGMKFRAPLGTPEADAIESNSIYGTGLELTGENVVDVDLSSLPLGLGTLPEGMQLQSVSLIPNPPEPQRVLVTTTGDAGPARRTMTLSEATSGPLGGRRIVLTDAQKALSLFLPVEPDGKPHGLEIKLNMSYLYPHEALEIVQFALAFTTAKDVEIRFDTGPVGLRLKKVDQALLDQIRGVAEFLEAIDRVQAACSTTFRLPKTGTATNDEVEYIYRLDRVFKDGYADVPWIPMVVPVDRAAAGQAVGNALLPRVRFGASIDSDRPLTFGGHEIRVPYPLELVAENLLITNASAIRQLLDSAAEPDLPIELVIEADDATACRIQRSINSSGIVAS